ncbi:MAG: preprotein translocase subunit YajC [Casimicrobiaceae bacterium]|nr:preprotein translocase subunit YajC [Casimicrobiaceae bacterium]MCX8097911.1 preprotein translocase subunit YajC [Casimicrobiaceae bacterium]MDW8312735.1 preprotein translocase subunit YajC [Burkholderiales bacterium]
MWGTAYAQSASTGAAAGSEWLSLVPLIAIFVIFYFLLIRPQQKRLKEQRAMIEALQKGDEVVTAGGVVGKIVKLDENYVSLETAGGTQIAVQRNAVSALLPKGSLKNL